MLMQPCLCFAYNGLWRIRDAANGLVHGCPENKIGCLRNFRFSIFDHVGLDLLSVKAEQRLVALFYESFCEHLKSGSMTQAAIN